MKPSPSRTKYGIWTTHDVRLCCKMLHSFNINFGVEKARQVISLRQFLISGILTLAFLMVVGCGGDEEVGTPKTEVRTQAPRTEQPTQTPKTEERAQAVKSYSSYPDMVIDTEKKYVATMVTNKGTVVFELFDDEAPKSVNNFVFLAREGYYDGVIFHRIVKNFMIQGGDPTGTGKGGPGYRFEDEPVTRDYLPGTLAMANAGPNTSGSQFFIVQGRTAGIAKNYNIFGMVTEGLDVVNAIADTPVTRGDSGEVSKPLEEIIIESVTIEEQ